MLVFLKIYAFPFIIIFLKKKTKVKAKYFLALAQYHRAVQSENDAKYGETVALITIAENIAKEAQKLANNFAYNYPNFSCFTMEGTGTAGSSGLASAALTECANSLLAIISQMKTTAIKDNDMIYHDNVPNLDTLPPPEKLAAVKPISFAEICPGGQADIARIIGPDIFTKLVPLSVHESSSMYSEEKAKILRVETDRVFVSNQELESLLPNVVQLLDKVKSVAAESSNNTINGNHNNLNITIPEDVKHWSTEVRREESGEGTESKDMIAMIDGMKSRVKEGLNHIGMELDKEQSEYSEARSKYGESWDQNPTPSQASRIRGEMKSRREDFDKAIATDNAWNSKLSSATNTIHILKLHTDDLKDYFEAQLKEAEKTAVGGVKVASLVDEVGMGEGVLGEQMLIEKIESAVGKLRTLKKDRNEVLEELKTKVFVSQNYLSFQSLFEIVCFIFVLFFLTY